MNSAREDPKMLRRCSSSVGCWWYLPEDIKVGILSRLPETDLFKSKLLSKEWNILISSICIPKLSPPNPATPLWGFLCFENPPPPLEPGKEDPDPDPNPNGYKYLRLECVPSEHYFRQMMGQVIRSEPTMHDHIMSLLPTMDHDPSHIVDCCNGLFLLTADSKSYFVGNPVTRQRASIPVSNHTHEHLQSVHSSLVFDPSISLHFKVFRYTRPAVDATPSNPLALHIFSSDSGRCSSHALPLEPHNLYGLEWIKRSVYFDGALYYMSMAMYLVCIDNVILKPTLEDGQYLKTWAVELPDKDKITTEKGKEALHGCIGCSLGRFYYSNRGTDDAVLVWTLVGEGKNSGWVLKHTIRIDHDIVPLNNVELVNYYKQFFRPRAFHPNDDVIILACPRLLVSYHLKTKYVEVHHIPYMYGRKTVVLDHNWIFPYSQSLVSINTIAPGVEEAN